MRAALFIGKRLLFACCLLLAVSFLVFGLQSFSKGSFVATVLGGRPATEAQIQEVREEYRLDEPFLIRYAAWVSDAVRLDFGRSIRSDTKVTDAIADRLPVTLELTALTIVIIVVLGVPLGMLAGMRRGTSADRAISTVSVVGLSAPVFATGIFLLYLFGVYLAWFPTFGAGDGDPITRLHHLALPSIALAATMVAIVVRQTRAVTLDIMQQDFVTFARARGLRPARILSAYALRNISVPVVTITGLLLIYLIGGTVLVEQVFSLQGLGQLMVTAIQTADIPVVQGITLLFAAFVVLVTLVVDIVAMWLDPRTMYPANG
jgi:peptide/nickel transport system permease protein